MDVDARARFDGPWFCLSPAVTEARDAIVSSRDAGSGAQIVLLYAEHGFGKTSLMDSLLLHEAQREAQVRRVCLCDSVAAESPSGKLSRLVREVESLARRNVRVAVGLDDLPPGSDVAVNRQARYIRRMAAAGALVIVCLLPEAEGLVEQLGEAMVIRSQDFLLGPSAAPLRPCPGTERERLTHGIPSLVHSIGLDEPLDELTMLDESAGLRYATCLSRVLRGHLRDTLCGEELSLRLSMVLLGSGSFEELQRLAPRFDAESLCWLEERAPLFGINLNSGGFEVAGVCRDDLLGRCLSSMRGAVSQHRSLVPKAMGLLCRQLRFGRAACVAALVSGEGEAAMHDIVLGNGMHFLLAGKMQLLEESLHHARMAGEGDDAMSCILRQMTREMSGRAPDLARGRDACGRLGLLGSQEREALRYLRVQARQRDLLSVGPTEDEDDSQEPQLPLEAPGSLRRFEKHHHVTRMLLRGEFAKAFDVLLNDPDRLCPRDLGAAFLCMDFSFAEAMISERGVATEQEDILLAQRLLSECGSGRLELYFSALGPMAAVLAGGSSCIENIEHLIAQASAFGDTALEAAFLLVAAVADLRADALARAHVRAVRSWELASQVNLAHLVSAALLVDGVARQRLGERVMMPPRHAMPAGELRDLMRFLSSASLGKLGSSVCLDALSRSSFPRERLWALSLIVEDTAELAQVIRSSVPKAWLRLLPDTLRRDALALARGDADAVEAPPQPDEADPRVRIALLGGFGVEVDGEYTSSDKLCARHGRDLLALLCLVRGHKIRKRDALLAIWGDVDYLRGVQRLYECITVIRRVLDVKAHGIEVIRSSRAEGTIELDARYVSCDVDEFVNEAMLSLGRDESDLRAMSHACMARKLYGAGPSIVLDDVTGISQARACRLKELYVAALVAGAGAALREGRPYLCAQLAQDALVEEPRREDAIMCLAEALGQMGRASEIHSLREQYRPSCRAGRRRTLQGARGGPRGCSEEMPGKLQLVGRKKCVSCGGCAFHV